MKNSTLLQQEEKLIELHNGCIFYAHWEDVVQALTDLAA